MPILLQVYAERENNSDFLREVSSAISEAGMHVEDIPRLRDFSSLPGIIVALSSAGVFTTLFQVFAKVLDKNKGRELIVKLGDREITLRNHSLSEEQAILALFSSGLGDEKKPQPARLLHHETGNQALDAGKEQ